MHFSFSHFSHSRLHRSVAVALAVLALCNGCASSRTAPWEAMSPLANAPEHGRAVPCGLAFGQGEIFEAAKAGDYAKVSVLLKNNPDLVSSKDDEHGRTPLHWAAYCGHKDIAELLLAKKADVNAEESDRSTPLHWAAYYGHKDMAELLLADGANVNAEDCLGHTPLLLAAMQNHMDLVKLLLAKSADVNAKAVDGNTPLIEAASNGNRDMVELLLATGADVNVRNSIAGWTSLDFAEDAGHDDVAELLGQLGGHK